MDLVSNVSAASLYVFGIKKKIQPKCNCTKDKNTINDPSKFLDDNHFDLLLLSDTQDAHQCEHEDGEGEGPREEEDILVHHQILKSRTETLRSNVLSQSCL